MAVGFEDPNLKISKDEWEFSKVLKELFDFCNNPLVSEDAKFFLRQAYSSQENTYLELFPVHYLAKKISLQDGVPEGFRVLEVKQSRPQGLNKLPMFSQILIKGDSIKRPIYAGNDLVGYRMIDTIWKWETPSLVWGSVATHYGKNTANSFFLGFGG